jgi:hypothetical protein
MELFFEPVSLDCGTDTGNFKWRFLQLAIILVASILFCKSANGQSPELKRDGDTTVTLRDVGSQPIKTNYFTFYPNPPFIFQKPSRVDSMEFVINRRFSVNQNKIDANKFILEMNHKLDSAWKEFDQRCRGRSN